MYIPKRIIVSPEAKVIQRTNEIIDRVRILNKKVEVIIIGNQSPERPGARSQ